jgi:hypothetical protein
MAFNSPVVLPEITVGLIFCIANNKTDSPEELRALTSAPSLSSFSTASKFPCSAKKTI